VTIHPAHAAAGTLLLAGLNLSIPSVTRAADTTGTISDQLQEIVVTASKRAERAQDVGESISVIGSAELEKLHVTSLQDLTAYVPGLIISSGGSPGQTNIAIRGFPSIDGPQVATILDDCAVGSSTTFAGESGLQLDLLPYDIERIEILRGPQGTLYGSDSMSGVLKYVTKYPSLTSYETQIGSELFGIKGGGSPGYGARALLGAPLIDGMLALRASVYDQQTPGYIKNPVRGINHENALTQQGARLAVLWQPAGNFAAKIQWIHQRTESDGNATGVAEQLGTSSDPYYRPGNWVWGDLTNRHPVPEPFDGDVTFWSATVSWNLRFADVTSATSYSDKKGSTIQDYSAYLNSLLPPPYPNVTPLLGQYRQEYRVKRFTQEIRAASPSSQRLVWLAGAYYSDEKGSNNEFIEGLDSRLALIPNQPILFVGYVPTTYSEAAAFGTLTYQITPVFDVTGGLRRLRNKQVVDQTILAGYFGSASRSVVSATDQAMDFSLGARYHLSHDSMVYARIASGYEPGVPNGANPLYPEIAAVTKPDKMVNYEVGIKSELLDRRATVDLAVFRMNWTNLQLSTVTPDGQVAYDINGGKFITQGFELSVAYQVTSAVLLEFNTAYMDAYALEAIPSEQISVGARPGLPVWTGAATIDYQLQNLPQWTPRLSGSWRYVDSEYNAISSQTPVGLIPGYSWVDLNLQLSKGRADLSVYVKNLFDKRAFNGAIPHPDFAGHNYFFGPLIQPRLIGLSASVKF
jgi:iron complex outermembrane receptor protein